MRRKIEKLREGSERGRGREGKDEELSGGGGGGE